MKEYIAPEITEISITETAAGTGSNGTTGGTPTPDVPWTPGINKATGHNSGSHSDIAMQFTPGGDKSGYRLDITVSMKPGETISFNSISNDGNSGMQVTDVSTNGCTFIRNGHFNPSDTVGFTISVAFNLPGGHVGSSEMSNMDKEHSPIYISAVKYYYY